MLSYVKLALRINNTAYDVEIQTLIDACKRDLALAGVKKLDDEDVFLKQAVSAYCKANFGLGNNDSEKYQQCFDSIKRFMCLSSEYTEVVIPDV